MDAVLVIDDQPGERRLLYHALKDDYRVLEAADGAEGLERLRANPVSLVLLDLHLPPDPSSPREGVRVLAEIREREPRLPVVISTGDQDRSLALDMVRRGVADVLLKPVDPDVLRIVVARALERARLERELDELRRRDAPRASFGGLIARSPLMRERFGRLARLARTPATVLLLGESGAGKSAVARALHLESPRGEGPFVVVDGATIPESLIESELFGHVRGAFTGAEGTRAGRIQMADGGTLFLDEIGNLSLAAQSKLLLFLDGRRFTPVGSNDAIAVDVRIVAATNRDLGALVRDGAFREDLLFRLQVATVTIPPLRDRPEDVAPLAEHFAAALGPELGRPGARLTPEAVAVLEGYAWPGSVRQLRHVIESTLALADTDVIGAGDVALPADSGRPAPRGEAAAPGGGGLRARVTALERELLAGALEKTAGNKAAAGRLLGLDENQIRYLCRKHGLG